MSQTGFYRVSVITKNKQKYFRYKVKNKLIHKEITRKDIYELKKQVDKARLLWGITNIQQAKQHSQGYDIKILQGKYGKQIQ